MTEERVNALRDARRSKTRKLHRDLTATLMLSNDYLKPKDIFSVTPSLEVCRTFELSPYHFSAMFAMDFLSCRLLTSRNQFYFFSPAMISFEYRDIVYGNPFYRSSESSYSEDGGGVR